MSFDTDIATDIVIIGAGMAGASLAAALTSAPAGPRVLVVEAEERPGLHATGRSAAFWTESYGGPGVVPLTLASGPMLRALDVLVPRGALTIGRDGERDRLDAFAARYDALGIRLERWGRAEMAAALPGLRPEWTGAVMEPDCCDIDVARLHQHYLASARRGGVEIACRAGLREAERDPRGWRLTLADGRRARAPVLVNAAGAWADAAAAMAGARPLGIQPFRRTIAQVRLSPAPSLRLPLVLDIDERFYFKPQGGRLWLSPHDETPSPPCDAAPEEIDVATAIARLEEVVDWRVEQVEHRWAGLRSFAPDRLPVYGADPRVPGFFWFAGQGGFGIQTAPAAAALAAGMLLGRQGGAIDPGRYSPARFG